MQVLAPKQYGSICPNALAQATELHDLPCNPSAPVYPPLYDEPLPLSHDLVGELQLEIFQGK